MAYISGTDRKQSLLLPETVEQYVGEDHPVRAVDAFVDALNLQKLGFTRSQPAETGRPPYDPGDLLKLFVWGYLNRVRSSRRLEIECGRNLEVIWLLRQLEPDFKTISDFRRDNTVALKEVFRQFVLIARELGLYGRELVAIDGTKLKASNHPTRRASAGQIAVALQEIDTRIAEYLAAVEENDNESLHEVAQPAGSMAAKLEKLRRDKEHYTKALEVALASGGKAPLTDTECQSMQKVGLGYNAQIAVDGKNHLIAVAEIAGKPTDHVQLPVIAEKAAEVLRTPALKVVADAGYHDQEAVAATEAAGLECYVPRPEKGCAATNGIFVKSAFIYEAENDGYRCPAGQLLTRSGEGFERHGLLHHGYTNPPACRACEIRGQCTKDVRRVERWEKEAVMESVSKRVAEHPEMMQQRKSLVEHPFGTIKFWWNQGALLTRGKSSVQAELSLSCLAYNMRRVVAILGVNGLIEGLEALRAKVREAHRTALPRVRHDSSAHNAQNPLMRLPTTKVWRCPTNPRTFALG